MTTPQAPYRPEEMIWVWGTKGPDSRLLAALTNGVLSFTEERRCRYGGRPTMMCYHPPADDHVRVWKYRT